MRNIIILTESGTDLPVDLVKKYNIQVVPMHVIIGGDDYLDGYMLPTDIFDYYKRRKKIPSTAATNSIEYQAIYKKIMAENPGCTIIHIGYSSKASSTYQNALVAFEGIKNVYHIDSLNVSGGEAAIVLKAVELIENEEDISIDKLIENIKYYVMKARVFFIPGDLEYLRAGGRVSNPAYLGASLLRLKSLIEIVDGKDSRRERI
jgi:DegV family protein with EDD domain